MNTARHRAGSTGSSQAIGVLALRPKRQHVVERLHHAGAEVRLATRKGGNALFAGSPVARRHVEQDVAEPVPFQPAGPVL
jgi:hypothetical protein